jgi:hypothetical protein
MKNILRDIYNIIKDKKWEIIIFLYVIISLYYVVKSGFIADDGTYYFLRGDQLYTGRNLWQMTMDSIQGWIHQGRFFPFSAYAMAVLFYIINPVTYKTVSIVCVAINVLMFGNLVYKITGSKRTKYIMMMLSTLFFQIISITHNAILSYHMFMQIMFGLLMLMLIYLHKYIHTKKKLFLILSIIFLTIALLTYEIGFIFIIIAFFLILYYKEDVKVFKTTLLYAIPVILVGLVNIILKTTYATAYVGAVASFDIPKIVITGIKQTIAAFPLSNYIFQHGNGVLSPTPEAIVRNITIMDALVAVLFTYIIYRVSKIEDQEKPVKHKIIFGLFCLSFFIMPGVLIALSEKYQNELYFGIAHLPVYLENFGLLMVFYWIFTLLRDLAGKITGKFIRKALKVVAYCVIIFITLLNQQNTRLYVDAANNVWLYPKEVGINAMRQDIFKGVTDKDTILDESNWPWKICNSVYFSQYTNRRMYAVGFEDKIKEIKDANKGVSSIKENFDDTCVIDYSSNVSFGFVKLGTVDNIQIQDEKNLVLVNSLKIYVYDRENTMGSIYYEYMNSDNTIGNKLVPIASLQVINRGTGTLYQLKDPNLIDFNSLKFVTK